MIKLDIGCRTQRRDVIGIDPYLVPSDGVKAALDAGLPFKDNSVDVIYAYHVLEHAPDLMKAMEELWRVCKEGSLVYVRVPHASSSYVTWVDPTHRHGLTIETFAAFSMYQRARFELDYARLRFVTPRAGAEPNPLRRLLGNALDSLANHNRAAQYRCERWWGPWVGFDEAFVILRAVKEPPPDHRRQAAEARRAQATIGEDSPPAQATAEPGRKKRRPTPSAEPMPDLDYSLEDFFQGPYRPDTRFYIDRLSEATQQAADRSWPGRILDVACGPAEEIIALSQRGWEAWGLDASQSMLSLARRKAREQGGEVLLVRAIAETLPFRDSSFDRVTCKGAMDHFAHPEAFVQEVARVLKPDGLAIIALANYESLSCRVGRWLDSVLQRVRPTNQEERPYWVPPEDHTFRGTYNQVLGLGGRWLELKGCLGVSLLWLFPGWGKTLEKLPRRLTWTILRTADGAARRAPPMADVVISVWSPSVETKGQETS